MFLLIHQFRGEFERRADLGAGQGIFAFHFFKAHAAGKAADHQRDGHSGPANDGFAVTDVWVNDDLVVHGGSLSLPRVLTSGRFLLPLRLRRNVPADEAGCIVLVAGVTVVSGMRRFGAWARDDSLSFLQSDTLSIRLRQELPHVTGDIDVAQFHAVDVRKGDALLAGAADVDERESFDWFLRSDLGGFDQDRGVFQVDFGKAQISRGGITHEPLNRVVGSVRVASTRKIDPQKTTPQHLKVIAKDVLGDTRPPDARLDIDGVRAAGELAVFDANIADATRSLAADPNRGEPAADELPERLWESEGTGNQTRTRNSGAAERLCASAAGRQDAYSRSEATSQEVDRPVSSMRLLGRLLSVSACNY